MVVKPVEGECSVIEGVMGILGRAWAGAVIQAIRDGNERFNDIARAIPGVTDGMLSARLRELCARGLVERLVVPGPPVQVELPAHRRRRGRRPGPGRGPGVRADTPRGDRGLTGRSWPSNQAHTRRRAP